MGNTRPSQNRNKEVVLASAAPPDVFHEIFRHIRSRFDYAHLALTSRPAPPGANRRALLRAWFTSYMREGWFHSVDNDPHRRKNSAFRTVSENVADILDYSYRNAPRWFESGERGFEVAIQDGLMAVGPESIIEYLKTLPVKTINRLLQFCAIPTERVTPCHKKVHERFFEGDQMDMAQCGTTMILHPTVKVKMTPFEVNKNLLVVTYNTSEHIRKDCVWYQALDSDLQIWIGMVW
ncbi:hypothetical protein HK104_008015 [Borealophlyctis nickersoniae]|nr:hypothetical protein HK104_008015 [Borealophlyctis nickersoniae]